MILIGFGGFSYIFSIKSPWFQYRQFYGLIWVVYSLSIIGFIPSIRKHIIKDIKLPSRKSVIWVLPSVLAIYSAYLAATNWEVFISEELLRRETYDIWISNRNVLRTLLFSCFIVPIAEEILFRGVLIGYVSKKVNIWIAILFHL
ncbi:hypothetical protein AB986_04000 [Alkalihalobacillus macyae]|uniref:CAAX prenyl protease 2/Lysostaphin resistance protein A-like domain-containing protein n=1 Tax=Guptibacillus hwajinpoensis TaxID=208199 RepID=A0A0J6D2E2_9BACL|nr:hypothetical protein AB986_04000 [Alkalihalobacillus macyae]